PGVVAGEGVLLALGVAQCGVDGAGEELGVAEGVGDPVPGDRVAVVAGVADQRPATGRPAGTAGQTGPAGERAADRATYDVGQVGAAADRGQHPAGADP